MMTANEIVKQITVLDFFARARWGVRAMLARDSGVSLEFGRGRKVVITLEANDTYTIEVGKVVSPRDILKGLPSWRVLASLEMVYASDLVRVIDSLLAKAAA